MTRLLFTLHTCALILTLAATPATAAITYLDFGSSTTAYDNGGLINQTQSIAVDINLNNQSITTSTGIGNSGNKITLTPEDHWITGSFPNFIFHHNSGLVGEGQNTDISANNLSIGSSYGGGKFVCGGFICIDSPSTRNISGNHTNEKWYRKTEPMVY